MSGKKNEGLLKNIIQLLKNINQLGPMKVLGYHKTIKECPKCGSKLNIDASMAQLYACPNCGYRGPIALNPIEEEKKIKGKGSIVKNSAPKRI